MKPEKLTVQQLPNQYPFYPSPAACGFVSPAADYLKDTLSLDQLLIHHPAATFFARAQGCSMEGAGIFDGDILIIDRSLVPKSHDVILVLLDGELIVKRHAYSGGNPELRSEHPDYPAISVESEEGLNVWGVITDVIHHLR